MTTSVFRIVQIYTDRTDYQLVSQTSRRLRKEFGLPDCAESGWNTELLRSPKLRMLAAREAADANVVILAAEEGNALPTQVNQWLDLWRCRSRQTRSTLIALLRRNRPVDKPVVENALHAFAISARMDFFCHSKVSSRSQRHLLGIPVLQ